MHRQTIAVISIILIFVGLIGFVVYKELNSQHSTEVAKVAGEKTEISSSDNKPSPGNLSTPSSEKTIPPNVGQSTPSNSLNNTKQPALLKPEQFGEYESYVDSDKYLRIDSKVGTGAEAITGKKVAVFYKGWLTNGQIFDESRKDESGTLQPFIFTPGRGEVIVGWDEGILGMKVGGTRRLVLPPKAAYGEQGQGTIPPNSVLIFDIQLLEVEQ